MSNKIMVCAGKLCVKQNGEEAIEAVAASLRAEIDQLGMQHPIEVGFGKCMRSCRKGCVVTTQPDMSKYVKVTPDSAREIVAATAQLQIV